METKQFLENILSPDGHYCVLGYSGKKIVQKFFSSIDEVINTAINMDSNKLNTFFGLASFKTGGSRKVDNIQYLKSFFLDLDCGASKDYPNKVEALDALREFCGKTTLPKPIIVNSGNGIHCYWALETSVTYKEWFPVAEKLKAVCATHGLLADPAVTSDGARILRVPTTHNHKSDTPLEVNILSSKIDLISLDNFSSLLGDIEDKEPPAKSAISDKMSDNLENYFKKIVEKTAKGNGCEQIKYIMTNQEEINEPLWRAGLSIAKFCVDGEKASFLISKNHPDYSEQNTIDKMERIKAPYWCTTFDEHNPDVCPSCPFWGKIKSPIVLGCKVKEDVEEFNEINDIPKYPNPYFRGANGGVYVRYSDADGEPQDKMIYHNDLYVVSRLTDPETGEGIVMRLHLPRDGIREFTVPLTAVTSKEEFRKYMSMQGVAVTRMDQIMTYTTAWVNELQLRGEADIAHKQYGWVDSTHKSFILGREEITKDGVKSNPPSTHTLSTIDSFEPKGTIDNWKRAMEFYNRDDFELHQLVVGASFGSPLVSFTTVHCGCLNLNGETGIGKTAVQHSGISVWGNPKELILEEQDTPASKMNRGEVYHNLPLFLDELTNEEPKDLSDLAYRLTGGRQRNRMMGGSNVERYRGDPWQLLAVTSANANLVEKISLLKVMPKAEAQRILECKTKEMRFETKEETDEFNLLMLNNYGHAGRIYIKSILNDIEGVKKLLKEVQIKIDTTAGLTAKNRFWSAFMACSMTGILLAKKAGLLNYDTKKLFSFVIDLLKKNLNASNDMGSSVTELLNDYIHEHYSNVLWIKSTDDARTDSLVIPEAYPKVRLIARYETDLKRAYLLPKPLKRWCGVQQIDYSSFIQDLKTKLNAKSGTVRLSKGTHLNLPATRVIIVDCKLDNNETERT
tara:strand:- start:1734 stop:4454 length:2721 start_codon:yes stop_codon:yes gene_type:complete